LEKINFKFFDQNSEDPLGKIKDFESIEDMNRYELNELSKAFLKKYFPDVSLNQWNDWKWQLKNSITSYSELSNFLDLEDEELSNNLNIPLRITPYYLSLIIGKNKGHLRKTAIPSIFETLESFGEEEDPLAEDNSSPVPGIVHRYPDRVLFLVTTFCSTYCRYCTRSRLLSEEKTIDSDKNKWDAALEYIRNNSNIRDVLISGGDPLTLSNQNLEYLLSKIRHIEHVEIIRIGTKVPAVLPQRVDAELANMLSKYHPLFMSLHFSHPDELTPESARACETLANAGIPLGSQTVLLKGVNDEIDTMKKLMHKLLMARVKPYYLYQCDPIPGSSHFRTSVEKGLEIMSGLRGHTSGYAIPSFVIDAPGGGGKIPLLPKYLQDKDENYIYLKNYRGKIYRYPNKEEK
jgi:lysine 2,3-aminomutase